MEASNQELRRLEFHEVKDALRPGLFPDLDSAPDTVAEWAGLDDLCEQHEAVLQRYASEIHALAREQAESPSQLNMKERAEREATAYRQLVADVTDLVWQARDCIEEWRAIEDDTEHERKAEISSLRARLAELEIEDLMRKRLAVWLDRLDPTKITAGLYPWALMAQPPAGDHRPVGPMARSFQPQDLQEEGLQ